MPEFATPQPASDSVAPDLVLTGTAHIFVAFDWGEEVDLEKARHLLPSHTHELARRRRTPTSFAYAPAPLRYPLAPVQLDVGEIGIPMPIEAPADATLFDFGGLSVAIRVPFSLSPAGLARLAGRFADSRWLENTARGAIDGLFQKLRPVIQQPLFSPLSEEYVVFQLPPTCPLPPPGELLRHSAPWIAGLARLEPEPLSPDEVAAAVQSHISYSPTDLFVPEWSAALLIDRDCEETLQTIEFANLQLLEYRFIDRLLDDRLADAYRLIHPLVRSWLPFWRTHAQPLRALGELRIDANSLFERTGNALKLVGDQYLARVHHLLAARFHLDDWDSSIKRSLDVVEGVYQVVSDQSATYRTELLEIIVILLIVFEIVMAFWRH
jgi:hypothetical protein